jgi:hypothetical protein
MSSGLGAAISSGFSQALKSGTRAVLPIITINGVDVSQSLYSQLKKVIYRQVYADQFDSLVIQFVDPSKLLVNTFQITPGIEVSFSVKTVNWRFPGDSQIVSMGSFVVDEVQPSFPPHLSTMKCIAATALGQAKWSNITRTWGRDIAIDRPSGRRPAKWIGGSSRHACKERIVSIAAVSGFGVCVEPPDFERGIKSGLCD